ncbi:MAG: UDP-3-O-(3-hydroxymyristoyl)glucosamine N-acyltransferase [Synechococcales cyanobacterium]
MLLQDIAQRLGCQLQGDPTLEIMGVAAIQEAGPGQLTFLSDSRYLPLLDQSQASAVIVPTSVTCPESLSCLISRDPRLSFAQAIELFDQRWCPPVGIHPTAVIGDHVVLGEGVAVAAHVVIGDHVTLGAHTQVHPNVTIYPNVTIGQNCILMAGAVIHERTHIGDRCIIHCGAVVGDDGFGYVPLADGSWYFMPQSGRVVLGNDVHIGSNTTVDRPAVGETTLADGVKVDNLVMIGHGVTIDTNSLLVAQVGLAGGVTVGRNVIFGGQSASAGHISIGDRVTVAARCGITSDVPANQVIAGFPHQSDKDWRREVVAQHRLPELVKTVRQMEKRLQILEGQGTAPPETLDQP